MNNLKRHLNNYIQPDVELIVIKHFKNNFNLYD